MRSSTKNWRFAAAVVLVVAACVVSALCVERNWLFNSDIVAFSRNLPYLDRIDIPPKLDSMASFPTFLSTFALWHSTWERHGVAYWRPLSMQAFWLQKQFFGLDHYDRWMWLSFVLHLADLSLFAYFVFLVTGRRDGALLSVALYGVSRAFVPGIYLLSVDIDAPSTVVLHSWKDQPDLWADCFIFGALCSVCLKKYHRAVALCAVSVCFKESGWISFVLVFVLLAYRRQISEVPWHVYLLAVVTVAALLYMRSLAGAEVMRGYHMGTNRNWVGRYLFGVAGYVWNVLTYSPSTVLTGIFVAAIWYLRKRLTLIGLTVSVVAAVVAVAVALCVQNRSSLLVSIVGLTDPEIGGILIGQGLLIAFWLFCAGAILTRNEYRADAAFFLVCGSIAALVFVASTQVLVHALHLAYAFQSALLALVFLATWDQWISRNTSGIPSTTV